MSKTKHFRLPTHGLFASILIAALIAVAATENTPLFKGSFTSTRAYVSVARVGKPAARVSIGAENLTAAEFQFTPKNNSNAPYQINTVTIKNYGGAPSDLFNIRVYVNDTMIANIDRFNADNAFTFQIPSGLLAFGRGSAISKTLSVKVNVSPDARAGNLIQLGIAEMSHTFPMATGLPAKGRVTTIESARRG